jgi:hypothetical protein
MRKFLDTFGLVISSFIGVPLFVQGSYALFGAALVCQYVSFLSYSTRIRNIPIQTLPPIFSIGYAVVLITYLLCCFLFKHLILS